MINPVTPNTPSYQTLTVQEHTKYALIINTRMLYTGRNVSEMIALDYIRISGEILHETQLQNLLAPRHKVCCYPLTVMVMQDQSTEIHKRRHCAGIRYCQGRCYYWTT